jgi:urease accessory protein
VASTSSSPGSVAISCSNPDRIGRDGALRLAFERRGPRTVLVARRFTLPLQALDPVSVDEPDVAVIPVLNPTGGLVGGDHLRLEAALGPGSHACLTTPSATRIYRTPGPAAIQEVRLDVGADAVLEYVPEHTIPFAGSSFVQQIEVTLGAGARTIVLDAFAAGRVARGEAWRFARLDATLTVRDATGLVARERLCLEGPCDRQRRGIADGAPYFATVLVLGPALLCDHLRLPPRAGLAMGVSPLRRGGAIVRLLAVSAPVLADGLAAVWAAARRELLGRGPLAVRMF